MRDVASFQRPKPGKSFADLRPEIAHEAFGWDPTTVSGKSSAKLPWRCERGHVFESDPAHRTEGKGCPYCSNQRVLVGYNDLRTTHPSLAEEADGWDSTSLVAGSNKKMSWKCGLGHIWEATVANRTYGATGCPYCSGRSVLRGFNDIATTLPDLASQLVNGDGADITKSSTQKRRWKCNLGHQWEATVADRNRGFGCPYCAGQKIMVGFNDLATINPDIAAQADGWDPTTVTAFNDKKRNWKCGLGHKWSTTTAARSAGTGCPVCANKQLVIGFNDLATTRPEIAAQAFGWDPTTTTAGTNEKRAFRCPVGHVVTQSIVTRVNSKGSCPICSNKIVLSGFNDLATTHPEYALQADGWDPSTVTRGSKKKLAWKCSEGHRWDATVANRTTHNQSCPVCLGRKVLRDFNDLATTHPEIAFEAVGWNPQTVSRGSHSKREWKCSEGHQWIATVKDRVAGYGCPTCAPSGYNQAEDGYLYLLENDHLGMLQVGISNKPDQRLAQHGKRDWVPLDLRGPMDGLLTRQLEQQIISSLRKRGAKFANRVTIEKFDGWTEAWMRESFEATKLVDLIKLVYQDED